MPKNSGTKRKLMITGASGVLGSNLASFYKTHYDVVGVYRQNLINLEDVRMVQADLCAGDKVDRLIDTYHPDVVIHCAALVDIDRCERDPSEAYRQNVLPAENLVRSLHGKDMKLVFISTDGIYSSNAGKHTEEEPEAPVNEYGRSKFMGEKAALSLKDAVALRTTFFSRGTSLKKSFYEQMISSLSRDEKVRGFDDVFFSPLCVLDLVEVIEQVLRKNLDGVFNTGASNGVSKFVLLCQIAKNLGLNTGLIKPISVDSLSLDAKRNKNAVMNVDRISAALGMKMPEVKETVARFAEDFRKTFQGGR